MQNMTGCRNSFSVNCKYFKYCVTKEGMYILGILSAVLFCLRDKSGYNIRRGETTCNLDIIF